MRSTMFFYSAFILISLLKASSQAPAGGLIIRHSHLQSSPPVFPSFYVLYKPVVVESLPINYGPSIIDEEDSIVVLEPTVEISPEEEPSREKQQETVSDRSETDVVIVEEEQEEIIETVEINKEEEIKEKSSEEEGEQQDESDVILLKEENQKIIENYEEEIVEVVVGNSDNEEDKKNESLEKLKTLLNRNS